MRHGIAALALLLAGSAAAGHPQSAQAAAVPVPAKPSDLQVLGTFDKAPARGVTFRGRVYFAASTPGQGSELWVTDGTPAGTRMVVDIQPDGDDGDPSNLVVFRDRIYFTATGPGPAGSSTGVEWWSTDGTAAGTRLLADIYAGPGSSLPAEPTVVGDRLYFAASHPTLGRELWQTDGTTAGTMVAVNLQSGQGSGAPYDLTSLGDRLVFTASEFANVRKPWSTLPGTNSVTRLDYLPATQDLNPGGYTRLGTKAFFTAFLPALGHELWVTSGTATDARVVKDIYPDQGSGAPGDLTVLGDRLLFAARGVATGRELWTSDGTTAGTRLVADIAPGTDVGSAPWGLTAHGDQVLFAARTTAGSELWATRGTLESTRQVADSFPGPEDHIKYALTPLVGVAGRLLYEGTDQRGTEPWVTDGSAAGTRVIADLTPGGVTSELVGLGTLGNRAIFGASSGSTHRVLAWTAVGSVTTARTKRSYAADKARRKKIVIPVAVVTGEGQRPQTGAVTITRKGKVVGTARLLDGTARIRIRTRLAPGRTHRLVVTWAGTVDVVGSQRTIAVKVKKVKKVRR